MKTITCLIILCLTAGLFFVACQPPHMDPDHPDYVHKGGCAKCGMKAPLGTYCAKCNTVCAENKPVECEHCNKSFMEGTYCKTCDAFMFDEMMKCPGCRVQTMKGKYCPQCNKYVGLPHVDPLKVRSYIPTFEHK